MTNEVLSAVGASFQALPGLLTVLNVVILLAAVFFFTSTLASHVLEYFVGFINSRGRQLRERLGQALGAEAAKQVYANPLIDSLKSGKNDNGKNGPSYIEPELFARAVIAECKKDDTSKLATSALVKQLMAEGDGDETKQQSKLVEWYKALTDRQTGAYTRWSFLRLFVIGLVMAVLMDIDVFHIATDAVRNPEATTKLVDTLQETLTPILDKAPAERTAEEQAQIEQATADLAKAVLKDGAHQPLYAWQGSPGGGEAWIAKLVGWLLAALATSLGAQFWFNILSESLKLRAAGKKPAADAGEPAPVPAG
ncbi:MAG: hypothetical protein U1E14_14515 [Geminicoccaceae bacterium]